MYSVRANDLQINFQGRNFAVRYYQEPLMNVDTIVIIEKQPDSTWIWVSDSAEPIPAQTDFATSEATMAWLQKLCAWITAEFAKIFPAASSTQPAPATIPLSGENGLIDQHVQQFIVLSVQNNTIVASVR